jgi:hypothetical protein
MRRIPINLFVSEQSDLPYTTYTRCRGIMSDSMPEGQGLDNSVSSQLAGNDIANLYGVINRDK